MNPQELIGPFAQLVPFGLILVVFYFLLIRPQQQKAKETKAMLDGLKSGDPVVTTGGIHGRVTKLAEQDVHLEVAPNVRIRVQRSAIGQVLRPGKGAESTERGSDRKGGAEEKAS